MATFFLLKVEEIILLQAIILSGLSISFLGAS